VKFLEKGYYQCWLILLRTIGSGPHTIFEKLSQFNKIKITGQGIKLLKKKAPPVLYMPILTNF
jgi:hypothetical protein